MIIRSLIFSLILLPLSSVAADSCKALAGPLLCPVSESEHYCFARLECPTGEEDNSTEIRNIVCEKVNDACPDIEECQKSDLESSQKRSRTQQLTRMPASESTSAECSQFRLKVRIIQNWH